MSEVVGLRQLQRTIDGIDRVFYDKELQKVNAKAAEPLVNRMHRLAPVGLTGNLADSIGIVKSGKNNKREVGRIDVGPRRKGGHKGFAGHLVEFGTKERRVKKRHPIFGFDRGKMPKDPFVEPAWEDTKDEVLGRVTKELSLQVTNYLSKNVPK